MIWIDITDPKYALFFSAFLPKLLTLDSILITTRESSGYEECKEILDMLQLHTLTHNNHSVLLHCLGGYGGESLEGKLRARMQRQEAFLALFATLNMTDRHKLPKVFLAGASVEGAQCAFGLGIPIVHFSDTPIAGHNFSCADITLLSRLTLPLSSIIFHPFVIPSDVYRAFGIEADNIYMYDCIDSALYLHAKKPTRKYQPKNQKPYVIAREEEYKAHYVRSKLSLWYESVHLLARKDLAQILIVPRYEEEYLHKEFGNYPNVEFLKKRLNPLELYSRADMMLGGGGTMNLEACFLGIPTISTRSLLLYHDIYLIKNNLMTHTKTLQEVYAAFQNYCNQGFVRKDVKNLFVRSSNVQASSTTPKASDNQPLTKTIAQHLEEILESIVHIIYDRFYK